MGVGALHAARPSGRSSNVGRVSGLLSAVDASGKVVDAAGPGCAEPDRTNDPTLQELATLNQEPVSHLAALSQQKFAAVWELDQAWPVVRPIPGVDKFRLLPVAAIAY